MYFEKLSYVKCAKFSRIMSNMQNFQESIKKSDSQCIKNTDFLKRMFKQMTAD